MRDDVPGCDTLSVGKRLTPEQRERERASVRFMRWVIDSAQAQGHVMTDPDTWCQSIGHRTGFRAACSCGWTDPDPVATKRPAFRHALNHLAAEIGESAAVDARKALSLSR